jgi:mono/diheme cytochrome c family protein
MKYSILCLFAFVAVGLFSCDMGPESPKGFSLPEGNSDEGKLVFLKYQCLACHALEGLEPLPEQSNNPKFSVFLGGGKTEVKTYADLLTSVINPSHKFAKGYTLDSIQADGVSQMTVYNDVMTVTELVNLVTFLQSNYELIPFKRSDYPYYGYNEGVK